MTKRDYCINELVETEKNYIEALAMIINVRHSLGAREIILFRVPTPPGKSWKVMDFFS